MYNIVDLANEKLITRDTEAGVLGCHMEIKKRLNGIDHHIKLSDFHEITGFVGFESVCEVIASRLGNILGLNVLKQSLIQVAVEVKGVDHITFACESKSKKGEVKISADDLYTQYGLPGEFPVDTFRRLGFEDLVNKIFVFDYLIVNRCRSSKNIEFLVKYDEIRQAPIESSGFSLFSSEVKSDIPENVLKRIIDSLHPKGIYTASNFLGSRVLEDNLGLVSKPVVVNRLTKKDKRRLFYNLSEVLPDYYKDAIWKIIWFRYAYLKEIGVIIEK